MNQSSDKFSFLFIIFIFFISSCSQEPATDVEVFNIYGNHMVLQRNKEIVIAGKANPNGMVTAEINGITSSAVADIDSLWEVRLPPMSAGGPYELYVSGKDTLVFTNIMLGDVYMASGQSNMVFKMEWINEKEEMANADFPGIRMITVGDDYYDKGRSNVKKGEWKVCTPENVGDFSAVAYFFAKMINFDENIPVGIITSAIGGTTIKGWIGPDEKLVDESEKPGFMDTSMIYSDYDDSDWFEMEVPGFIENQGFSDYEGYFYFRKSITIPEKFANQPLLLHLGKIDDKDVTWLNGQRIGETNVYNEPRIYEIPADLVKAGENIIVVRVLDGSGKGGFWSDKEDVYISDMSVNSIQALSGKWKANNTIPPQFPLDTFVPGQRAVMFNAMVKPFTRFPVTGILWYQGEADVSIADIYDDKLTELVKTWRNEWDDDALPFLFVQLPNFMERTDSAVQKSSDWARQREAQAKILDLDNTGMAVTIDIGEAGDVHPKNKRDVGKRLALIAEHMIYGKELVYSGPVYKDFQISNDTVKVSFELFGSKLKIKGDQLKGFAIAGEDNQFVKPLARIKNDMVYLSSDKVNNPVAVRYNWADNPEGNLYNEEGLPAAPFRTDN